MVSATYTVPACVRLLVARTMPRLRVPLLLAPLNETTTVAPSSSVRFDTVVSVPSAAGENEPNAPPAFTVTFLPANAVDFASATPPAFTVTGPLKL